MKNNPRSRTGKSKISPIETNRRISKKQRSKWHAIVGWIAIASGIGFVVLVLLIFGIATWPAIGAQGADFLRSVIGDKAVAGLEMDFNQLQDSLQKLKYQLAQDTPVAPWSLPPTSAPALVPTAPLTETTTSTLEAETPVAFQPTAAPTVSPTPVSTSTPAPTTWPPVNLTPLSSYPEEGVWSAYIQDAQGHTVGYRTFLQPDPTRPYTLVAVVAIDLTHTRLHFVLGTTEPAGANTVPRSGAIPQADRAANVLLAAFNGGFKARHGQFGAMAGGITALPPRDGLGTLAIYQNGRVGLGEWGAEITQTPNMVAFRQNGPLVIQHGQINPRIYNNSPQDWGYTVNDVSPTVRSGIGLSADENTLFYFCGPSLSMEMLARTMQAAGASNAIQLDINNYWTLFVKFQPSGQKVIPEPLLPKLMVANVERYLWNYSRDYFYITGSTK